MVQVGQNVMSAKMSVETFQRLTLLYLIGQFENGVYSSFRLQKVLYYGTRDAEPVPFTFCHTAYGQYSRQAAAMLTLMLDSGLVEQESLLNESAGSQWRQGSLVDAAAVKQQFRAGFPAIAKGMKASIKKYGYLPQSELDDVVHADPLLEEIPYGNVLLKGAKRKYVETELDAADAQDLELLLSPGFLHSMGQLGVAISKKYSMDSAG